MIRRFNHPPVKLVGILLFFVLGATIYLLNMNREYRTNEKIELIDDKLIAVQKIHIDFLDAVGNNRGFHIKQLPLYINNYVKLKSAIFNDLYNYDRFTKDSIEERLAIDLGEIIDTRFSQLDFNLELLEQNDLESSIKAINAKDTIVQQSTVVIENRFVSLKNHLMDHKTNLLQKSVMLKQANSIIFLSWTLISAVLVGYFILGMTRKSKLLSQANRRLEGIFNSTFSFIGFLGVDGTILKVNQSTMNFDGNNSLVLKKTKFWEWDWLQLSEPGQRLLRRYLFRSSHGTTEFVNLPVRDIHGREIMVHANIKPLFSDNGAVEGLIFEGRPIQELIDAQNALIKKNEELQNFASIAAHDLREPLRMVASFMSLIQAKYATNLDEKGKKYIDLAVDGAKRMGILINDILEYASVGSEKTPFEKISVNSLMVEIKNYFSGVINEKKAVLSWEDLPEIMGQRIGLKLLIQNLVGNSMKYQQAGVQPSVHVKALDKGSFYQFCIQDNGIGIAEIHLNAVFTLFKRLHNKQDYPGTGMGLATCKKIVEQHGGEIWVTSKLGEGSFFYFTLPKNQPSKEALPFTQN